MENNSEVFDCPNTHDGKHNIGNNTASMRYNGTCGACQNCTCMFTPQECFAYYKRGDKIDENLLHTLTRFGFVVEGIWHCASCDSAISSKIDRVEHFKTAHQFH